MILRAPEGAVAGSLERRETVAGGRLGLEPTEQMLTSRHDGVGVV